MEASFRQGPRRVSGHTGYILASVVVEARYSVRILTVLASEIGNRTTVYGGGTYMLRSNTPYGMIICSCVHVQICLFELSRGGF